MKGMLMAAVLLFASAAWAGGGIAIGAAPKGDAKTVAERIIRANFEKRDCPSITKAERLSDKSIRASCSNGESYRVCTVFNPDEGRTIEVALRCSAARQLGIDDC